MSARTNPLTVEELTAELGRFEAVTNIRQEQGRLLADAGGYTVEFSRAPAGFWSYHWDEGDGILGHPSAVVAAMQRGKKPPRVRTPRRTR